MRQIDYNNSSHALRLEFPTTWDIESISGVDITIRNTSADDLLAETAATLYTATTLDGAVSSGSNTVTLDSGAGNLAEGDVIRLTGPQEDVVVRSYNTTTKVATLESTLVFDHADDSDVYPCWCTYALDTSDTDTWANGLECTVEWVPDIDGAHRIELAQVKDRVYAVSDFADRFTLLYPRESMIVSQRLSEYIAEATEQCRSRLALKGIDSDKVVDQGMLDTIYVAYCRWLVVSAGGDEWSYDRGAAWEDYVRVETELANSPIWVDEDMDFEEDDGEVDLPVSFPIARSF